MSRRSLLQNPYVWAFFAGIVTLTALRPFLQRVPEPPEVIGQVPAFEMVDQDGRPFSHADLDGGVWVASFFFTRCRTVCPALMQSVARLQESYRAAEVDVHLVSFSVDPEHDTPERLREYAARMGADPERWTLVTGDRAAMETLLFEGFRVPMGGVEELGDDLIDIAHTAKLVLVDPERGIRGYYGTDAPGRDEVLHRAIHVLREWRRKTRRSS